MSDFPNSVSKSFGRVIPQGRQLRVGSVIVLDGRWGIHSRMFGIVLKYDKEADEVTVLVTPDDGKQRFVFPVVTTVPELLQKKKFLGKHVKDFEIVLKPEQISRSAVYNLAKGLIDTPFLGEKTLDRRVAKLLYRAMTPKEKEGTEEE